MKSVWITSVILIHSATIILSVTSPVLWGHVMPLVHPEGMDSVIFSWQWAIPSPWVLNTHCIHEKFILFSQDICGVTWTIQTARLVAGRHLYTCCLAYSEAAGWSCYVYGDGHILGCCFYIGKSGREWSPESRDSSGSSCFPLLSGIHNTCTVQHLTSAKSIFCVQCYKPKSFLWNFHLSSSLVSLQNIQSKKKKGQ